MGTFSKNNVPKLKNNQSKIVILANSNDKGTHWIAIKFVDTNLFISIRMEFHMFLML